MLSLYICCWHLFFKNLNSFLESININKKETIFSVYADRGEYYYTMFQFQEILHCYYFCFSIDLYDFLQGNITMGYAFINLLSPYLIMPLYKVICI